MYISQESLEVYFQLFYLASVVRMVSSSPWSLLPRVNSRMSSCSRKGRRNSVFNCWSLGSSHALTPSKHSMTPGRCAPVLAGFPRKDLSLWIFFMTKEAWSCQMPSNTNQLILFVAWSRLWLRNRESHQESYHERMLTVLVNKVVLHLSSIWVTYEYILIQIKFLNIIIMITEILN